MALNTNLVAGFVLDEGTGTTLNNLLGGSASIVAGTPTWTVDPTWGNCLNVFAVLPMGAIPNLTANYTVAVRTVVPGTSSLILMLGSPTVYQGGIYMSGGQMMYFMHGPASGPGNDPSTFTATGGVPCHLAFTVGASGNLSFFANGVAAGTLTGLTIGSVGSPTLTLFGGADNNFAGSTAIIREVYIWSRVLSGAELTTIATDKLAVKNAFAVATTYTAPLSPTTVAVGNATTATITPNNSYSGTITGTPSGSASTGLLAATTPTWSADATPKTMSWTPTVPGTLTITWTNSGGLTNPANGTVTVTASALVAGAVLFDSAGPAGSAPFIKMTATDATGGTGPYTYQWQRKTGSGGTFANLTNGSGVAGATTRTLTDGSATTGNLYFYQLIYTDSAGTPATATSSAVSAQVYAGGALTGTTTYSRGRMVNG